LNKHWKPITTVDLKTALKVVFRYRGKAVDTETYQLYDWAEWENQKSVPVDAKVVYNQYIKTQHLYVRKPEVIVLGKFAGYPNAGISFSRRGIYERDNYQCQYCGVFVSRKTATIDHVLPVSKGGQTTWTNCVTSCHKCNSKKADKLLHVSGMSLRSEPVKPTKKRLILSGVRMLDSWKSFLTPDQIEHNIEVG